MTSPLTSKASYFEAWISNSGCCCARAINFFLFPMFFRSGKSFQLLPITWPSRVTLKLEVTFMVYVTFVISACICPTAVNILLFPKFFRSRKSFQLLSIAWPSRVTLKLMVTSWSTWLLLSLLVFVLPWLNVFLFRKIFRSRNSFQLLPIAWPFMRDLETEGHVMVYVTFVIFACICPTALNSPWRDLQIQGQALSSRNWQ